MRQLPTFLARCWLVVPILILGLLAWHQSVRIQRIEHIATLTRSEAIPSDGSITGYKGGLRERVLSDHDSRSYEWIAEAQRLLGGGEWRVRRVMDENAPIGRTSHAASPYRWWLSFVGWIDHQITGSSRGAAVERARVYADPLLHALVLIGVTSVAFLYAGQLAAMIVVGWGAFLYPFAARYFPGVPDDSVLQTVTVLGSILPLYLGFGKVFGHIAQSKPDAQQASSARKARVDFIVAGLLGGLGFWLNPASQAAVLLGIVAGAVIVAAILRSSGVGSGPRLAELWRVWSLAGALTVLLSYFAEYYPRHLGEWELRAVHPLDGLAWLGLGELLARLSDWVQRAAAMRPRDWMILVVSLAAVLSLPFAMYRTGNPGVMAADTLFYRLTNQPNGVMAPHLLGWFREGGSMVQFWATLLPVGLCVPASWLLLRRKTAVNDRAAIAITLMPALMVAAVACFQIRQWLIVDTVLLALIVATTRPIAGLGGRTWQWGWAGAMALIILPGMVHLFSAKASAKDNVLSLSEGVGVVERDLAHWLSKHSSQNAPALVLAPPRLTTALIYYGGLRGIPTLAWENQEGLSFAIRSAISTSRDETAALLRQRGVTHIVMPSWDRFFDSYVQAASVQLGELFYPGLERWKIPPWLNPVPFQLPSIPGFEQQSVKVFEVVDDQDAPTAAARLTEYFIEMGQLNEAKASQENLLKYPADFTVQVARAQLHAALSDEAAFTEVFEPLLVRLKSGADRYMPWDRRVSLAMVLAQGNQMDLARSQLQRCLAEITQDKLRSVTSLSLYRFVVLSRNMGLEFTDAKLRDLALDLLPVAMKQSL